MVVVQALLLRFFKHCMHRPVVSCCHSTFLGPSNQSCLLSVFNGARSVVIHSNRECMHDCSLLLSRGVHTGKSSLSHKRWLAFALQCFSCCCLALAPWTNRLGALTSGRVVVEAVGVEVEAIGMEVEANGVEVEANGVEVKEIGAAAVGTMGGGNRAHRRCQIQMQHWNLHPSTRPRHRLRKRPRRAGTNSAWRQLRPRLLHTRLEQRRRLPGVSPRRAPPLQGRGPCTQRTALHHRHHHVRRRQWRLPGVSPRWAPAARRQDHRQDHHRLHMWCHHHHHRDRRRRLPGVSPRWAPAAAVGSSAGAARSHAACATRFSPRPVSSY